MGRTVAPRAAYKSAMPAGFFKQLNEEMMVDLFYSLAAQKHPEVLCPALDPPSLEDVLDKYLADCTWEDFWDAFPFDLRDQGSCLDELDALGLLLASPISRRRFERHFEELAAAPSGGTAGSGSAAASPGGSRARVAGGGRQQQPALPPFSALPPAARQPGAPALSMRVSRALLNSLLQQQQQAQQQQQHVVTVSPAAPGRMQAAAHAPPPASSMQHPYWRQLLQRVQGGEQGDAMDAEAQQDDAAALGPGLVPAGVDPAAASRLLAVAAAAPGNSSSIAGETLAFAGITRTALRDAASAAAQAAAASQPPPAHDAVLRSMLSALGEQPSAEQLQQQASAGGNSDARDGRLGSQAAGRRTATPAAAAAAAAAGGTGPGGGSPPARLTGQRRTWQEVCDPQGFQQQQAAAAAAADDEPTSSGTGAAAGGGDGGSAAPAAAAADASSSSADMSGVWRAVHEWMTGEDEDLLALVAEVVPYRLAGKTLRSEAETRQQLQALAASQRVPRRVVSAVADKLSQPWPAGDARLVRLTASSGFSRSAAAAAAALECCDRHDMRPLYVSLAGLSKEEDVAAAVLQALVDSSASGAPPAAAAGAASPAPAAAEAGVAGAGGDGATAGTRAGQAGQQQQEEAEAGSVAPAAGAPAPAPTAASEQEPQPADAAEAEQQGGAGAGAGAGSDIVALYAAARAQVLGAAAEGAAAGAAGAAGDGATAGTQTGQAGQQQQGGAGARSDIVALYEANRALVLSAATAAEGAAPGGGGGAGGGEQRSAVSPASPPPRVHSSTPPPDSGMSGCGEDAVDQLAAHLTLLGRWYASQPLLLLLDETDAASLHEDGRVLRELLMRLLTYLPQAVVAVVSSSSATECLDASALRHKDDPVLLQLHDGQLRVLGHQLPRSPLAMMHSYGY